MSTVPTRRPFGSIPSNANPAVAGPVRRSEDRPRPATQRRSFERGEEDDAAGGRYDRRERFTENFQVCRYKGNVQSVDAAETKRYIEFYDLIYNEGIWFRVKRFDNDAGWGFYIEWFGRDIRQSR